MRKPRLILAALAGGAVFLGAAAALADNQTVQATSADTFNAAKVAVKPGEKVVFTNRPGDGEHNIVWNDGKVPPTPADSVDGSQWPAEVSRSFDKPGRYRYFCALHGDKTADFGMFGYVYVNGAGTLPPVVSKLKASGTKKKYTVKFSSTEAGKAKVTLFKKSDKTKKFARKSSTTFSAKNGSTSKTVTKTLAKGSYRVDLVVTDANKVASDLKSKTFKVS
jgi:plastocyanin